MNPCFWNLIEVIGNKSSEGIHDSKHFAIVRQINGCTGLCVYIIIPGNIILLPFNELYPSKLCEYKWIVCDKKVRGKGLK